MKRKKEERDGDAKEIVFSKRLQIFCARLHNQIFTWFDPVYACILSSDTS